MMHQDTTRKRQLAGWLRAHMQDEAPSLQEYVPLGHCTEASPHAVRTRGRGRMDSDRALTGEHAATGFTASALNVPGWQMRHCCPAV